MEQDLNRLLEQIGSGDERAFDTLAGQYAGMTENAVRRFAPSFAEEESVYGLDDLRQCAQLALYRAAVSYDPGDKGKKVSFGLYAKICVDRSLVSLLRKCRSEQRRRRSAEKKAAGEVPDPMEAVLSSEGAHKLIGQFRGVLSRYETKVFDEYIMGKSVGEIAERLGKNERSVSNALYRTKVKIRGLLKKQ